jgi:hypothetical protein
VSGRADYDRMIVDAVIAADAQGMKPKRIGEIHGLTRGQVAGLLYRLRRGIQSDPREKVARSASACR